MLSLYASKAEGGGLLGKGFLEPLSTGSFLPKGLSRGRLQGLAERLFKVSHKKVLIKALNAGVKPPEMAPSPP